MDIASEIAAFRATISPNLLGDGDFIDWREVNNRLLSTSAAIVHLQRFVDSGNLDADALASELTAHPEIYGLLLDLIAFNGTGAQVEKWGLPQTLRLSPLNVNWVAQQLHAIGVSAILANKPPVRSLLQVAEVYKDSFRRRFRAGKQLEVRVRQTVINALNLANLRLEGTVRLNPNSLHDAQLRRSLSFVLAVDNRPIAGIATVFQNQSGGRQQRDLSATYPNLQDRLQSLGMALILLADGQGLREASDRTLTALFEGVRFPMTLVDAADGKLSEAIVEAATTDAPETFDQAALNQIIQMKLRSSLSIESKDLPVTADQARLALAYYAKTRRRVAVSISPDGNTASWSRSEWVQRARTLKASFDSTAALDLFCDMLSVSIRRTSRGTTDVLSAEVSGPPAQPFADALYVSAGSQPLSSDDAREIGRRSMEIAPGSHIALYITARAPTDQQMQQHRKNQVFLPANVIIVSTSLLEEMATDQSPISQLMDAILSQSDLTKVSPFILNNATPARMFYGRESEAATILSTITTNSVAILGSRRIGKTSLIRRVEAELAEARFQPFFADCQTVRTWGDFGELATKHWQVDLPNEFRPVALTDLIEQLKSRGDGQVVIILDEIDQLLDWDQTHQEESVPEAFFRACRAISQEGLAQFVFSGERRIANRLWDPQSPHWNFCRELQLRQLDVADATSLLMEPLLAMNIEIQDRAPFEDEAWKRTSGHPQIVQFLGDRLVQVLNDRVDRRSMVLSPEDIASVTETFDYAEHYLTTYWGQASKYERTISEIVSVEEIGIHGLRKAVADRDLPHDTATLASALRMLQLYGIVAEEGGILRLRAEWFPQAMAHFAA